MDAEAQTLEPSSAAFPGASAENLIRSGTAEMPTWDIGAAGGSYLPKPQPPPL